MQDAFFHFFSMLLNGAYASNFKLGGNLEFSWYSCNILKYCSNRCIVWFFIPENCPAQANRKFPVQLYVKIQILFEPPFWICKWANHLSFLAMLYWIKVVLCLDTTYNWRIFRVTYKLWHMYLRDFKWFVSCHSWPNNKHWPVMYSGLFHHYW